MKKNSATKSLICLSAFFLSSCASINSTVVSSAGTASDGIAYYLPIRPIKITATLDEASKVTAGVTAGDTIPDLSRRFTMTYGQNYFGTNHAIIGVNSKGLLESANNTTTSSTGAIATAIGGLAGAVAAGMVAAAAPAVAVPAPAPAPGGCKASLTYTAIVFPETITTGTITTVCGLQVSAVKLLAPNKSETVVSDTTRLGSTHSTAGLFYRRDIPYLVTIKDSASNLLGNWIAYSPDESEVLYYPVSRTLFANSQTNFTFTDGLLTQVDQSTDSEVLGALQFPANVISGYTTALGNIFGGLSTAKSDQATAASNQEAALLAKIKLQSCQSSIAANDPSKQTTEADAATAVATIKAACQ